MRFKAILSTAIAAGLLFGAHSAQAQRHYSFGYDQPKTTGFGVAGDISSLPLSPSPATGRC